MNLSNLFGIVLCALLVACGGGGGDLSPTPAPAPTVASASYEVVTNNEYTYQLETTGTGLSFSIPTNPEVGTATVTSGGLVAYSLSGVTTAPNKKIPVTVNVSNSTGTATATLNFAIYKEPDLTKDPLTTFQWHLKNIAQDVFSSLSPSKGFDLNVLPAWASGITGNEVIVNVVDSGLELAHPDLAANITPGSVNFGGGSDPTNIYSTTGDHGTSVAGLIASVGENGLGGKGVAYRAKLMGHNYLGGPTETEYADLENLAKAYGGLPEDSARTADVFNASYGISACIFILDKFENDIYSDVKTLRGGKGGLVVKSAGNGFGSGEGFCRTNLVKGISNANAVFDGNNVVDNIIVVASVNAKGVKSSYSTTGANIWLSGFGGEYGQNSTMLNFDPTYLDNAKFAQPAMITTDQSGCTKGYHTNKKSVNGSSKSVNEFEKEGSTTQTNFNSNCNYTSIFNGTSSAAPTVSGVIALMLEARPALTWRDVKDILAKTAKKVDSSFAPIVTNSTNAPTVKAGITVEQAWVRNDAGFHFHNWYGFGLVDAAAAVSLAKTHTLLGSEKPPQSISVSNTTLSLDTPITFQAQASTVETVTFKLNLANASRTAPYNCMQFELTSPKGTQSILLNGGSGFAGYVFSQIEFLSNAFYGENASGTWTLLMKNICTSGTASFASAAPTLTIRGR